MSCAGRGRGSSPGKGLWKTGGKTPWDPHFPGPRQRFGRQAKRHIPPRTWDFFPAGGLSLVPTRISGATCGKPCGERGGARGKISFFRRAHPVNSRQPRDGISPEINVVEFSSWAPPLKASPSGWKGATSSTPGSPSTTTRPNATSAEPDLLTLCTPTANQPPPINQQPRTRLQTGPESWGRGTDTPVSLSIRERAAE